MKGTLPAIIATLALAPHVQAQQAVPSASPPPVAALPSPLAGLEQFARMTADRIARANNSPELMGSGPFPAMMEVDLAFPNATIYRPVNLNAMSGTKLGVLIWGNGGCSNDGASARAHLAEIASRGFLVVAPGKPLTGPLAFGAPVQPSPMQVGIANMRAALDWALAENGRTGSPYYRRIDPKQVATAGHSCGGMLAIMLAQDPRIRTVIIHNSGIFPVLPDNPPILMHRERLQGIHTPVLFLLGGKSDVAWQVSQQAFDDIERLPTFLASIDTGHEGTFAQPHGGAVTSVVADWLAWRLRGDQRAARTFSGADCKLCNNTSWTIRKKNIP